MTSEIWKLYKSGVQNIRDNIAKEYQNLYGVLEACTHEETRTRVTVNQGFNTLFDECVVCLKMMNVRTEKSEPMRPLKTDAERAKLRNRRKRQAENRRERDRIRALQAMPKT